MSSAGGRSVRPGDDLPQAVRGVPRAPGKPFPGCLFAYTYESRQFGADVLAYIRQSIEAWLGLYDAKLAALITARTRAAGDGAGACRTDYDIVEGGLVMAKAFDDATYLQRQSAQYRAYLGLLFPTR